MKVQNLVSIIVPIFRKEDTLERCLRSIQKQVYTNLEIILVDDGSPDSCGTICDRYAESDQRITVIHKKNGGVSSARNAGIKISSGEFITFIDADDEIHPKMIEELINNIKNHNADISACSHIEISSTNDQLFTMSEAICQMFTNNAFNVAVWSKLYRAYLFDDTTFPETIHLGEDMLVTYEVICKSERIVFTPKCLYYQKGSNYHSGISRDPKSVYETVAAMESIYSKSQGNSYAVDAIHVGCLMRSVGFLMRCHIKDCTKNQLLSIKKIIFRSLTQIKHRNLIPLRYKISGYVCLFSLHLYNFFAYRYCIRKSHNIL